MDDTSPANSSPAPVTQRYGSGTPFQHRPDSALRNCGLVDLLSGSAAVSPSTTPHTRSELHSPKHPRPTSDHLTPRLRSSSWSCCRHNCRGASSLFSPLDAHTSSNFSRVSTLVRRPPVYIPHCCEDEAYAAMKLALISVSSLLPWASVFSFSPQTDFFQRRSINSGND
ncbi:hypothetical protein CORC01_10252 [Colletotrichum orchidophilum]|uniref:Uncharacterized protein n=1 Tax=Colletotrichum orchidophilum TaxID=1209926 RepID=A0A1G4AZC2_9PEZI|nr:uncharacterized protein CORC01_10252 [Colletotrichum orchidophilum]OHE94433.1 hypothetical protein CORC01_10252 [Colletotrichum orchidophilum]